MLNTEVSAVTDFTAVSFFLKLPHPWDDVTHPLLTAVSMTILACNDRSRGVDGTIQLYDQAYECLAGAWLRERPVLLNYMHHTI